MLPRLSRGLAHDFEFADDGALMQVACKKRPFIETCDEGQRVFGSKKDVEEERLIAPALWEPSAGIDWFRAHQDMPFADIVAAGLDRLAID
jgi:hypothetical protein